jgi:DNA ligase (NAD+)
MNLNELKTKIRNAAEAYYNDEPIMTDQEFDTLKDQLMAIAPNDPLLSQIGAPVQNDSPWTKAKHKIPMTSLNKVNTTEEFNDWYEKCGTPMLTMSEKLDGLSIDLEYEKGNLIKAITRGDGVEGEEITRNVLKMKNVKAVLPKAHATANVTYNISLRGEIIMTQEDFDDLNEMLAKKGKKQFKNKRNAAAGIARGLDGENCEYLSVVYYDTTLSVKTAADRFDFIRSLGLPTALICGNKTIHSCATIYDQYEESLRAKLNYDIDGLVVEVNDLDAKFDLGELYGNPKGAIAWKFGSMKAQTKIVDIEWQLGNSGRVTPVAVVVPVQLAGVTVQKASLHNLEMFEALKLGKGDVVIISRRNDVIPYIESVVSHAYQTFGMFMIPKHCPVCHGNTKKDGKFLVCDNPECEGKVSGNVKVWVKKLELKGIASATIETLCAQEMITEPSDLYSLTEKQLHDFGGFGKRQSEIIFGIINSKKEVTLPEFIGGLNIPQFGRRMTDTLVEAGYDTLDKITNMSVEDLIAIKGIEMKTANAFLNGIRKKKEVIKNLLDVGIKIKGKEKPVMAKSKANSQITGKSFVFTGAIERIDEKGERYTRNRLQELVIQNGGMTPSSITKGVSYLVQADPSSTSSKTQKAEKFGVEIISEKEFFKMLGM